MESASEARKIFANNLTKLLKSRPDINLKKVSDKSGISYNYLSSVKGGKENITVDNMDKIAAAMGLPLYVLLLPEEEQ
jgi:transcriptional regulator with XRE-family HTH domain